MRKDFSRQDFYDLLEPNGECLEWTGSCIPKGYGATWAYGKMWYTHRLALHLEGIDTSGHMVLHSCDNPRCCNPEHMRLGTHQENMRDMRSRGRQSRGEHRPAAKLTEQDILDIRAISGMSQRAIADQYGVTPTAINLIINRKSWHHI